MSVMVFGINGQITVSHETVTTHGRRNLLSAYTKTFPVVNRRYKFGLWACLYVYVWMCSHPCQHYSSISPKMFSVSAKFPQCCCCARSCACWGLFLKPAILTHTKVLLIQSLCWGLPEQICCSHRETHSKLLLPFSHMPSHLKRLVNS